MVKPMCLDHVYTKLAKSGIEMLVIVREGDGWRPTYINGDPKEFTKKLNSPKIDLITAELMDAHEELFCNFIQFGVTYFIKGGHNHTLMMGRETYKHVVTEFSKQANEII